MANTPNHDYNVPAKGAQDWHTPLNDNFETFDTDIELRDTAANRSNYDPKAGAKFLATDTGVISVGDGTNWTAAMALARYVATGSQDAGTLVFGHPNNTAASDVKGATISGGGKAGTPSNSNRSNGNTVAGNYATVAGGVSNIAQSPQTTVGGGTFNTASGTEATVGGGGGNIASGSSATVGGGSGNTASDDDATVGGGDINTANNTNTTVSGGIGNTASGSNATVGGGGGNTASGQNATVAGGKNNTASGQSSFAAGEGATAEHEGAFVWSDRSGETACTGKNQFLVAAAGGVGIGTNAPATQLHVADSVSGAASTANHVAAIENTASGSGDVLALKIGEATADIGGGNNFITFKDTDDNGLGAIEGTGSGGVTLKSGSGDFAESLPRREPDEPIEPADIVGVIDGGVTRRTAEADQALVVSAQPIVTGNTPAPDGDGDAQGDDECEPCAFVGQVPVKVRGAVEPGEVIVPSGEHDGTGRAIAVEAYRPGDGPLVGRAWEGTTDTGITEVTVAVGLETGDILAATVDQQAARIAELDAESERKEARIEALEAEQDRKDGRIEALEERLRAVEQAAGVTPGPGPASADD